jgi:hypothetical protein
MISDFVWIWVGIVSLWVVISVARRISSEKSLTPADRVSYQRP